MNESSYGLALACALAVVSSGCGDESPGSTAATSATGVTASGAGGAAGSASQSGGSDSGGAGGAGVGGQGGSPAAGSGGAPACNMLVDDGPTIDVSTQRELLPAARGGIIEDGTYVLTENVFYSGDTGDFASASMHGKLRIDGGAVEYVYVVLGDAEARAAATLTTQSPEFTFTYDCPDTRPAYSGRYTASPTTLSLFLPHDAPDGDIGNLWTFTKQP